MSFNSQFGGRAFARLAAFLLGVQLAGATPSAPPFSHDSAATVAPEPKSVRVTTRREGEATQFLVENNEFCEITMTFEMGLVNLKGASRFPYTATFPPRKMTKAFTLSPVDPGAKWSYTFTNYYKLGSNCARHDDSCVYQLPYAPGSKFKVSQGYNGKYSHKGSNQYAIDWQMPEGTPVYAARGGVVVRVKDDSHTGGPSMDYDRYNNYILIRHEDGTLGHYCHLQQGGCVVKPGQKVAAGEVIAHSGNTGFSSGPHLHFCVFKTKDGRERVSIPVKFQTSSEQAITLVSGRKYRATEGRNGSVSPAPGANGGAPGAIGGTQE